jgi:two-component system response regulator HydG
VLTGHADVPTGRARDAAGRVDFLEKPVDLEALAVAVTRGGASWCGCAARSRCCAPAAASRRIRASARTSVPVPSLERLIELAARNDDVPVLIVGETGTGKGFVARRITSAPRARRQPFVEVNGASLSATFLESELFGHERGAFTDAKQAQARAVRGRRPRHALPRRDRRGRSPTCSPSSQGARGADLPSAWRHARSCAATRASSPPPISRSRSACARERFRADLYYRLQVLTLALPPLRERRDELARSRAPSRPPAGRLGRAALRTSRAVRLAGQRA